MSIVDKISRWSGKIISYMIFPLFVLIGFEVFIMRFLLNSPTMWTQELTTFIFGAYFMLGGAYCLSVKGHVAMDMVYNRLSPRWQSLASIPTFLAILLTCGLMVWFGGPRAWNATLAGERLYSTWAPLLWPIMWAIPVGAGLVILQAVSNFIRDIQPLVGGREIKR
ncbi:TRAP transporter small permease subunit [Chloroflexota bacterium]